MESYLHHRRPTPGPTTYVDDLYRRAGSRDCALPRTLVMTFEWAQSPESRSLSWCTKLCDHDLVPKWVSSARRRKSIASGAAHAGGS